MCVCVINGKALLRICCNVFFAEIRRRLPVFVIKRNADCYTMRFCVFEKRSVVFCCSTRLIAQLPTKIGLCEFLRIFVIRITVRIC